MHDQLEGGVTFRLLNVIDDYNREAIGTPGAWHALTTSRLNSLEYRPRFLLAGHLISEISIASSVSISTRC